MPSSASCSCRASGWRRVRRHECEPFEGGRSPGNTASSMRRRHLIAVVGGAAITWPYSAVAQQKAMPVIGFLNAGSANPYTPMVAGFRRGLRETGYIEGQNLAIEYRWAEGQYDKLPSLAADLVRQDVGVIAAATVPAVTAAKAATMTIPIVFAAGGDPVQLGLFARPEPPGGKLTGGGPLNPG